MRQPVRILVGSLVATVFLLAMPALAAANGDDDDGGGSGGAGAGGITWSVQDNGASGDLISGALEPASPPPPGTPLCGALPPEFPVSGNITVEDNLSGRDRAFGSGNVPVFGAGEGAPFSFDASSGALLGEDPTGTFELGFPTGRPSSGRVTCLQVVGNIAYIGGEKTSGDDDGDDDGDDGGGGDG
jgi:hypothetical protein